MTCMTGMFESGIPPRITTDFWLMDRWAVTVTVLVTVTGVHGLIFAVFLPFSVRTYFDDDEVKQGLDGEHDLLDKTLLLLEHQQKETSKEQQELDVVKLLHVLPVTNLVW
ncbi:hypothetical protein BDU57DRAFT_510974 [Ampelomyces quisqualis]|uniref:Uncharacterized protein n=1 Tax=Ampelomyces quisqualis TaxID=50730 RepID=A0A6A5R4H7_AMPQU|nr:hypothetical protein BDU57DRAFT_510974 [Ampelomyces quisqualis]